MQTNASCASRVRNSLKTQFIADALAMPVHWFYNPMDIEKAFPGGIQWFDQLVNQEDIDREITALIDSANA
ncbi:hypothetical protein [Marinobacter shengliensis]|uniref:hypothetical protein n=1 Tax=Marinobacter shengliensis TaxID=1389223 RepID=UPI001FC90FE6|nr:hypothetical protein [Marinobacter shengliensis]